MGIICAKEEDAIPLWFGRLHWEKRIKERQREAKNESEVVQGQIMRGWCVSYRVWIQPQCLGNQWRHCSCFSVFRYSWTSRSTILWKSRIAKWTHKGRGLNFSLFALFRTHCRVNKYNISNKIIFSQSVHLLIYQLICVCDLWLLTVNDHQYKGQTGLAWAAKRHKQVPQPFTGCINMNKCSKRNKKKRKNDIFFKPQ